MSRVIRSQTQAKTRSSLLKILAHAVAADQRGNLDPPERRDILAFCVLILEEIMASISTTSSAWEKQGYWLKADRFTADWAWARKSLEGLNHASAQPELAPAEVLYAGMDHYLSRVVIPGRMRGTKPWEGAWKRWKSSEGPSDR